MIFSTFSLLQFKNKTSKATFCKIIVLPFYSTLVLNITHHFLVLKNEEWRSTIHCDLLDTELSSEIQIPMHPVPQTN